MGCSLGGLGFNWCFSSVFVSRETAGNEKGVSEPLIHVYTDEETIHVGIKEYTR